VAVVRMSALTLLWMLLRPSRKQLIFARMVLRGEFRKGYRLKTAILSTEIAKRLGIGRP
jgi:hypothetical protein